MAGECSLNNTTLPESGFSEIGVPLATCSAWGLRAYPSTSDRGHRDCTSVVRCQLPRPSGLLRFVLEQLARTRRAAFGASSASLGDVACVSSASLPALRGAQPSP